MEISKMLTVSTAHISPTNAELLDEGVKDLIVYKKDDYGWFINVPSYDIEKGSLSICALPIHRLIVFAKDLGCDWLCFDRDGEILDYFSTYGW